MPGKSRAEYTSHNEGDCCSPGDAAFVSARRRTGATRGAGRVLYGAGDACGRTRGPSDRIYAVELAAAVGESAGERRAERKISLPAERRTGFHVAAAAGRRVAVCTPSAQ